MAGRRGVQPSGGDRVHDVLRLRGLPQPRRGDAPGVVAAVACAEPGALGQQLQADHEALGDVPALEDEGQLTAHELHHNEVVRGLPLGQRDMVDPGHVRQRELGDVATTLILPQDSEVLDELAVDVGVFMRAGELRQVHANVEVQSKLPVRLCEGLPLLALRFSLASVRQLWIRVQHRQIKLIAKPPLPGRRGVRHARAGGHHAEGPRREGDVERVPAQQHVLAPGVP
mmetsp:Transcript_64156/g.165145  ORF Transcript_64156/g.165145 Transcript_64156/m.165145 type:complete len:228 (+) Transcript_64156:253-936(+)